MEGNILNALLNTVMGMGVVFVVLILISFIISLFIFIPKIQEKFTKKPETNQSVVTSNTVSVLEEEELVDDTELVAVITAAIMASMGEAAPKDGLRVRSIHRVNTSNWANV